jgi:PadR family transcriptional regulator PadR
MMGAEGWLTQVRKGLLELCILNLLREEPLYGYEIVKRLTVIPELVISEGTIYPILNRLKKEKLVSTSLRESDRGPVRKYYTLTAAGRTRIAMMNSRWDELRKAITRIVKEVP